MKQLIEAFETVRNNRDLINEIIEEMPDDNPTQRVWKAFNAVARELDRASAKFPAFASAHEGYAIIEEELIELRGEVFQSPEWRSLEAMREEAVQLAAMAIRFLIDVGPKHYIEDRENEATTEFAEAAQ